MEQRSNSFPEEAEKCSRRSKASLCLLLAVLPVHQGTFLCAQVSHFLFNPAGGAKFLSSY